MKLRFWGLFLCLAVGSGSWARAEPIREGREFPRAKVEGLPALKKQPSVDLKGSVSIVVFWASWCSYCKKQLGELDRIFSKYEGKGLKVLGVSKEESRSAAGQAAEKLGFPQVYDYQERVSYDLGIAAIPMTVVLDRKGRVHSVVKGYSQKWLQGLPAMLEPLLSSPQ